MGGRDRYIQSTRGRGPIHSIISSCGEGGASLEDAFDDDEICSAITSRGTTTNNAKSAKDDDDKEGRMVGILHFWVCAMGHMEAVAELITERDIYCLEHLTDVTRQNFEDGNGFELRFTFDIKING